MKTQSTSDISAAIEAAQWIGFSDEAVQVFRQPTPALQPAVDLLKKLPEIRAFHAAHGVSETLTRAVLVDLELWMRDYRQKHGRWGFENTQWLSFHFGGKLYALGRLQFEIGNFNLPVVPGVLAIGDPVLKVHIPATGKLDDVGCGEAFRQACEFFPRHFPEHKFTAFTCESWMMDRQLERWLPAESNLVRFLRRFHPLPMPNGTDEQMWERVFGSRLTNLATAPRDTALQRAMLDHIAAGGQWKQSAGYILREEIR